jgi:type II secretion system protein D
LHFGGEGFEDIEFASVGQEIRFAADTRTNTLIAAGAEVDLRMVEELIRYLDAQEAEDRIVEVIHAKYRDAQELANAVSSFSQQEQDVLGAGDDEESLQRRMERQVSVEAIGDDEEGSSSLILGTSRRMYQQTMGMIGQLDRPEPQVMISVVIAEVTLDDAVELGIEFAGQDLHFSENAVLGPNGIIQGDGFDYVLGTDVGAMGAGLGGLNFTVTGEDFSFLLHAAQQYSRVETLSRPILLVRNGEEGKITIANDVPFVAVSGLSDTGQTQSQVSYEEVGIVLTATPHISPDGYVTIELTQEISDFSGENVQLTEGVSSPVFQTREVDTNVTLRDGETVIIGGLIQTRDSEGENKVPILGDLPLLGPLFRVTRDSEDRSELLLALTVDILRTDDQRFEMSRQERDLFMMPDSIRQSPLMGGLRILPDEEAMGPVRKKPRAGDEVGPEPKAVPERREKYGPKPKVYGPTVVPKATKAVARPVYGPQIASNDLGEKG